MKQKKNQLVNNVDNYLFSSSYEPQEDVNYESGRNDTETENIEVDEPVIPRIQSVQSRYKQDTIVDSSDPLFTGEYLETTPKRKSSNKRHAAGQLIEEGECVCFFFCVFLFVNSFSFKFKLKLN